MNKELEQLLEEFDKYFATEPHPSGGYLIISVPVEEVRHFITKAFEAGKSAGIKESNSGRIMYQNGVKDGRQDMAKSLRIEKIGFLRQWLNENRITEPEKMVTNMQIELWLLEDNLGK